MVYDNIVKEVIVLFGKRLRELRESKGLSMDRLTELYNAKYNAKMNKSTLSRYENELQTPIYTVAVNLADFFDVSIDYLLGREQTKSSSETSLQINSSLSRINAITDRMAEMRLKAGLSREELAEKAGVSIDVIANLEEGKGGINGENVDRVAKALNTNFDYLMGLSDDSTPPPKSTLAQLAENPPAAQPVAYIFGSNGGRKVITDKTKIELIKKFAEFLDNNEPEQK